MSEAVSDKWQGLKLLRPERREIDLERYTHRRAEEGDYERLVTEPSVVVEDGEPLIVYLDLDREEGFDSRPMVRALRSIRYSTHYRTGGLKTTSRTFGFAPRNTIRADFCTAASVAAEHPEEHAVVVDYAAKVDELYRRYGGDTYGEHAEEVGRVLPDWRLRDSVFTSGIINKNNPLKYHFDTGNFRDVWSNMLVFKHDVRGGHLSVPEFGLGFELKNNSCFMFDGQGLLHGVTPIRKLSEQAVRFSVVFYSLRQMWNCDPLDEELARVRQVKTERERKRRAGADE